MAKIDILYLTKAAETGYFATGRGNMIGRLLGLGFKLIESFLSALDGMIWNEPNVGFVRLLSLSI